MAIYMDYPQITTMEHLQTETSSSYGSVLKYEEHVLVTDLTSKGSLQRFTSLLKLLKKQDLVILNAEFHA